MARGDTLLYEVAKSAVLSGVNNDRNTILYRQNILKDCLRNPFIVRAIYNIAGEAMKKEKKDKWGIFSDWPSTILHRSIRVLHMFMTSLKELKRIADKQAERFESEGFTAFFAMLRRELGDEYFASVEKHLRALKFRGGVLISAELGKGNKGTNYCTSYVTREGTGVEQADPCAKEPRLHLSYPSSRSKWREGPVGIERQGDSPCCECARPVC